MPRVIVLGDINVDVLMRVPAYPQPGGEVVTDLSTTQLGGSAANTAVVLAKLGLDVHMLGRVGGDAWAELALEALAEAGVGLDLVQRDSRVATGMMFTVVTPDGERTMFGHRGANKNIHPTAISLDTFTGAEHLHLSGYALLESPQREAAWRAMELAVQAQVPISLDTALMPALVAPQPFRELLPCLDVCVLGVPEARELVEVEDPQKAAAILVRAGVRLVGVKLGAQGCLLADSSSSRLIPAFPVQAVDTTGAGDAFAAGLIFGRLRGLSPPALGTLANALGGLAATVYGGGLALPGKALVKRFLKDGLTSASGDRSRWISEALQSLS